jgi:hypothetical protein
MMPDQVDTLEWWEESELRELDGEGACWSVGSTAAIRARRTASATFATTIRPILRVHHRAFSPVAFHGLAWRLTCALDCLGPLFRSIRVCSRRP